MAQPFSYRYPLVDGQGNWGSQDDPKSFAAMRYTEAKLTRYAEVLLAELGQGTVDWVPNFDGTLRGAGAAAGAAAEPAAERHHRHRGRHGDRHPAAQPARGGGRLRCSCWKSPTPPPPRSCKHVQGPDLPTGAEIISPRADLTEFYDKGNGTFRARATWEIEEGNVVITALPYQVSRRRACWNRSPSRCAPRSCRWSTICATSRITRIRRAW